MKDIGFINIVLATDDNYAQHATVAMTSVLVNSKHRENIRFFVINDNISPSKQIKILESIDDLGGKVLFVEANENALNDVYVSGNITRATYLRLDISNILPKGIHKAIYIDCDLLVYQDIYDLWSIDLQGRPLAATEDFGILSSKTKSKEKERNLAWNRTYSYFNAGVLLINLELWRSEDYGSKLINLATSRNFRHHDQDTLNLVFMNNWKLVDLKWNVIPPVFNMSMGVVLNEEIRMKAIDALDDVAILHYAGGYKPWEHNVYKGFNDKYYEYLNLTRFKDAIMPQPNVKKKGKSIVRQLWRLKWANFIKRLLMILWG